MLGREKGNETKKESKLELWWITRNLLVTKRNVSHMMEGLVSDVNRWTTEMICREYDVIT